jgi:hypothetical protein
MISESIQDQLDHVLSVVPMSSLEHDRVCCEFHIVIKIYEAQIRIRCVPVLDMCQYWTWTLIYIELRHFLRLLSVSTCQSVSCPRLCFIDKDYFICLGYFVLDFSVYLKFFQFRGVLKNSIY